MNRLTFELIVQKLHNEICKCNMNRYTQNDTSNYYLTLKSTGYILNTSTIRLFLQCMKMHPSYQQGEALFYKRYDKLIYKDKLESLL